VSRLRGFHINEVAVITETNAVNFRQNLGETINRVQYRHDSVVINKDGKPVAALVDARLFERIRRMQGRFDALCHRIEAGFVDVPEASRSHRTATRPRTRFARLR
jgi:prevent-host-death family protein